jgi:Cu(I)/Ag(I) efflux system membrane fusion protein
MSGAGQGRRAAAAVRWVLVAAAALAAAGAWTHHLAAARDVAAGPPLRCPMHPSIVSESAGACPVCGMDLVAAAPGDAGTPAAAPAPAAAHRGPAPGRYTCPMHLEFGTDDAAARCPECHMRLIPRAPSPPAPPAPPDRAAVEVSEATRAAAGVRTVAVVREALAPELTVAASLAASEERVESVTLRFSGWIDRVEAWQTGQRVEKGDLLATVYSVDAQAMEQVYLSAIRWAGKGDETGAAARDVEEDARRRLRLAGIADVDIDALARRGAPSASAPVRAPISGYVARRGAVRGAWAQAGTELFQIVDLSRVWALAEIPERELSRVRIGARATVALAAFAGERFEGRVAFLSPSVHPASRTLQARIEVANPRGRLRPGMSGEVTVRLDGARSLTVPRDALVDAGGTPHVFVAGPDGRLEPRTVRVAGTAGDRVAVTGGVREGEQVVAQGVFLVDAESRLRAAAGPP